MKFRVASIHDVPVIQRIANECWPVAYGEILSKEQIVYMLDKMYSNTALEHQILEEGCEFIIATIDNEPIGFASWSLLSQEIAKLHKLYLLSSRKGKGYGKKLMHEVIIRVKEVKATTLELQVNKNNPSQLFYLNYGFERADEIVIDIGGGFVMDDYLMRYKL